jgi:hypothetical protein
MRPGVQTPVLPKKQKEHLAGYQWLTPVILFERLRRRGLKFQASQCKKAFEKSWLWWCAPVIPAMVKSIK